MNPDLYDIEQVNKLRQWENLQLEYFGFCKDENANWVENQFYRGDALMKLPERKMPEILLA